MCNSEVKKLRQFALLITFFILGGGLVWGWVMFRFIPSWWFPSFPFIPLAFFLFGLAQISIIVHWDRNKRKQPVLNVVMIQRFIRLLLLIVMAVLMILLSDLPKLSFAVNFMGFYILLMILEIISLHKIYSTILKGGDK